MATHFLVFSNKKVSKEMPPQTVCPAGARALSLRCWLLIAVFSIFTLLPGRFDYELHPCNSPFGPAKLFKFVPDKFIASLLNKTQSAVRGRLPLCWQYSANLKGRVDQNQRLSICQALFL